MGRYNRYKKDSTIRQKVLDDLGLSGFTDEQIQYAFGGMLKKGLSLAEDYGKVMADDTTNVVGIDVIKDSDYNNKTIGKYSNVSNKVSKVMGTTAATVLGGPAGGAAMSGMQTALGTQFSKQEEAPEFQQHQYVQSGQEFLADGGNIHIKKSHEGRFTEWAKSQGLSMSEAIQKGLHSKNKHVRSMAQFAANSRKWKHENGGSFVNEGFNELPIQGALGTKLTDGSTNPYRRDNMYDSGGKLENSNAMMNMVDQELTKFDNGGAMVGLPAQPSNVPLGDKRAYNTALAQQMVNNSQPVNTSTKGTLSEYYKSKGKALPSVMERKALAKALGIKNYDASSDKNTELLQKLNHMDLGEELRRMGMEDKVKAHQEDVQQGTEGNVQQPFEDGGNVYKGSASRTPEDLARLQAQLHTVFDNSTPETQLQQMYKRGGKLTSGITQVHNIVTPEQRAELKAQQEYGLNARQNSRQIGKWQDLMVRATHNKYEEGGNIGDPPYKTQLSNEEESKFKDWYNKVAKYKGLSNNPDSEDQKYDYRGYWKNEPKRDDILTDNPDAHFTDTYKQPGHPTFSDESMYSNKDTQGGSWSQDKNGKWYFHHSPYTQKYADRTTEYLQGSPDASIIGNDTIRNMNDLDKLKGKQLQQVRKYGGQFEDREGYKCGGKMKHHADGGLTNYNGASHEQGGINIPNSNNQVEGGEVGIPKNMTGMDSTYVASDNLKIDKATAKEFNIDKKYIGETPAKVLADIKKKTDFRQNDPIDKQYTVDMSKKIAEVNDVLKENKYMKLMMKLRNTNPQMFQQMMAGIQQQAQGTTQQSEGNPQDVQQDQVNQQNLAQGQQSSNGQSYSNDPSMSLPNGSEMQNPQQPVEQHRNGGRIKYFDGRKLAPPDGDPILTGTIGTTPTYKYTGYSPRGLGGIPDITNMEAYRKSKFGTNYEGTNTLEGATNRKLSQEEINKYNSTNTVQPITNVTGDMVDWPRNTNPYTTDGSNLIGRKIYSGKIEGDGNDPDYANMIDTSTTYNAIDPSLNGGNPLVAASNQGIQFGLGTKDNPLVGDKKQVDTSTTTGTQFKGNDLLNTVGLGNAFDLVRSGLAATNRKSNYFGRINANQVNLGKIDPTQQLMNLRDSTADAELNMRNSGANMSQYLANRTGLANQEMKGEGELYANVANQNVQLRNQQSLANANIVNQANAQNQGIYQGEQIANAQDKAQILNTTQGALTSTQGRMDVGRRDDKAEAMQREVLKNWVATKDYFVMPVEGSYTGAKMWRRSDGNSISSEPLVDGKYAGKYAFIDKNTGATTYLTPEQVQQAGGTQIQQTTTSSFVPISSRNDLWKVTNINTTTKS